MSFFDWTDLRIDYLRRWWGKAPPAQIANKLGCTKSSLIGKAHRLGLPNLGNPVKSRDSGSAVREPHKRRDADGNPIVTGKGRGNSPIAQPLQRSSGALHQAKVVAGMRAAAAAKARLAAPLPSITGTLNRERVPFVPSPLVDSETLREHPAERAVRFADLHARGCQFPVTPHNAAVSAHRFCNARREDDAPYCPEHRAKCWAGRDAPATQQTDSGLGAMTPWSAAARVA